MAVPVEFTAEFVKENSPQEKRLYHDISGFREPFKSLFANHPWMRPPSPRKPLVWGPQPQYGYERYWDTTVARKHEYWKDFDLPKPTKNINQLRHDLVKWGFCLIEDGLSKAQYAHMKQRLLEQAEAEAMLGVEWKNGPGQYVASLVNKGECFVRCIEQDPQGVQAAQSSSSWVLHQDAQGFGFGPFRSCSEAPILVNTAYVLEDTNEENGGTILIPGSHKILSEAGLGPVTQKLPPPINLEAPGGTVVMWDGRLLHGAGANRSKGRRYVCTASSMKPWLRSQELWALEVKREVLEKASPKLLHRMGFQAAG
eukprot:CAMPEP_0180664458 /NCGR_PEP_ID=MMETSP1037_2-20121125/60640_1 /TAXON_ID=632150 /ORGANISM="Azadinium spinosum, Strain 3D9" /LENGTH=311 /DNA_ID=CAMNT_0022692597 /DNA_START=48 /DNA_END=980 /DNA_ORIENTATION=-